MLKYQYIIEELTKVGTFLNKSVFNSE